MKNKKMKQYVVRTFVKAKSVPEAVEKSQVGFKAVEENPFTTEEETAILEIARVALRKGAAGSLQGFQWMAEELDLSDKELMRLQEKIENKLS